MAGGGGFGVERFTLSYLYDQHIARNNIWTKTNKNKDLCRYLKCTFYFYRHPYIDFVVQYRRQPPFNIDQTTYPSMHPLLILLGKHHKYIPSLKTKPKGKNTVKLTIKPPKQMINKWFFTEQFCQYDLLQIAGSACSFLHPRISSTAENRIITIYYLNPDFFQVSDWGQVRNTSPYEPYTGIAHDNTYIGPNAPAGYKPTFWETHTGTTQNYYKSVSYNEGWFSKRILTATQVKRNDTSQHEIPVRVARYNPVIDNGKGNQIWLTSITGAQYHKPSDPVLLFENTPLWLAFYGWWNYIQKLKDKSLFTLSMFVIKSPFILPPPDTATRQYFPFIDLEFIQGKNPNNSPLTYLDSKAWYANAWHQVKTINSIVECGPYIPKYSRDRESSWDLHGKYSFYFKWGGDDIQNQDAYDPSKQATFQTPGNLSETIQISDPSQQIPTTLLHAWDIRRGLITPTALKRIRENLPTDDTLSTDSDHSQPKKKKVNNNMPYQEQETQEIQNCLQALFEKDTYQEPQTQEQLLQLIQQQHQQQNLIKFNLLHLIADLKKQQQSIKLHTGLLN